MEIEAKYRVADRQPFDTLLRMTSLGDFTLVHHTQVELQHNTYYDTPERHLAAHGLSLRIRETPSRHTATVKSSRGGLGALHLRDEWEAPIGADHRPTHWPSSALRDRVLDLTAPAQLTALFTIQTRRRRVRVLRLGRAIAEMSLDEGHIRASGRILGFRELEVELGAGESASHLASICSQLLERFPLVAEPRGKRSRGIALLRALAAGAPALLMP
jgi:triphosphatase